MQTDDVQTLIVTYFCVVTLFFLPQLAGLASETQNHSTRLNKWQLMASNQLQHSRMSIHVTWLVQIHRLRAEPLNKNLPNLRELTSFCYAFIFSWSQHDQDQTIPSAMIGCNP